MFRLLKYKNLTLGGIGSNEEDWKLEAKPIIEVAIPEIGFPVEFEWL